MITTAVISFREFLEVFLIVGVFLGISRKLNLKKEFEIGLAAVIGICFSLLLATGTYFFGNQVRGILTEKNAELLESYLMIFSGLFLAYVIFSLHNVLRHSFHPKFYWSNARFCFCFNPWNYDLFCLH